MFKKMLTMVLVVCSLLGCFAAFAETDKDDRITVVYWNLITGKDADVLNEIIDTYNNSQDSVYIDCYCWDWGDYYTKLRLAILSGTGPDLALAHCDNVAGLYAAGCMVNIEEEFKRLGVDYDFSTNISPALESVKFDGSYYSVPQDVLAVLLYYNKGVYRELGLLDENGQPNFFGSMEDWMAAGQKVEENYDMYGTAMPVTGYFLSGAWLGLYYQLGGDVNWLGEDGMTEQLDTDLAIQALEALKDLYSHNALEEAGWDMFANGLTPLTTEGSWSANYIINYCAENDIELGICPMPAPLIEGGKAQACFSHSLFLPVNEARTDEVTKAALEFVKWYMENNELWAQAGHLPANAGAYEPELYKSLPMRDEYVDAPAACQSFPVSPAVTLYTSAEFNTPVEQYLRGELTADECLEAVRANLATIFESYQAGEQG